MFTPLDIRDRERCMDLAERVGWPREPPKWDLLFAIGRAYGVRGEEGALRAMVAMPKLGAASFVAMMVVDPVDQGRGLGRELLAHAMADNTPPFMLYATAEGRPLYERLGFRAVDGVRKHIGVPRATQTCREIRRATAEDHDRIVEQDTRAFGCCRASLIRALLGRADRVLMDRRAGFAVRWFNGHLAVVGPVVAADQEAAIALIDGALEGCSSAARVDVPVGSRKVADHVRSLGLHELEPAPLMTAPQAFLPGDRSLYHAIALQALG